LRSIRRTKAWLTFPNPIKQSLTVLGMFALPLLLIIF
jgi:hypothetical protein